MEKRKGTHGRLFCTLEKNIQMKKGRKEDARAKQKLSNQKKKKKKEKEEEEEEEEENYFWGEKDSEDSDQ